MNINFEKETYSANYDAVNKIIELRADWKEAICSAYGIAR